MRIIITILQKEFRQIFRNRTMLPIIFVLPLIQTLVLVYAATLELKNAPVAIVDYDNSTLSHEIVSHFDASPFFGLKAGEYSAAYVADELKYDHSKAVIIIPRGFQRDVQAGLPASIQMNINAIDGQSAGLIGIYAEKIIGSAIRRTAGPVVLPPSVSLAKIDVKPRYLYNETLNFKHFMLPGILTILVTMIGCFLTALNLIREKEMGTIEQINVSPVGKFQFLIGKILPFWVIGLFDLALGIGIGMWLFHLPFAGSVLTLFVLASVYLFTAIGLGILVTDFARTQQQVMFTLFFFFLLFVLMSGIFTSVESMPHWAQEVNRINPVYYFMKGIRMILLKGSGLGDIAIELISLGVLGSLVMAVGVWQYRKTS
ncbi:MAG TPA: ABC transporter permease [Bacteroidales bacterium]|nr:ABC transporter permease [Bacteroidales bacterium]